MKIRQRQLERDSRGRFKCHPNVIPPPSNSHSNATKKPTECSDLISIQMVYHNQKPQTNIRHKFHQQGPSPSLVRMEFLSPVCALQSKRFDTFDTTVHVHTMQVAGYTSDSSYSPTHPSTCRIQFFRSQTSQCMINRHQGVLAAVIRHRFL